MDVLEGRLRTAEHGRRRDHREAAGVLRGGSDAESMARAAVLLTVGDRSDQQFTPAGRKRV
eukprot:4371707-Prymnesium_polylepis.1